MGSLCIPKNLSSMSAIKNTCKKPLFISFEGIEGMGKSTQIEALFQFFIEQGFAVIKTREPGGSALGEDIRNCLLKTYPQPIDALTELSLLIAARRYHLKNVIEPALANGSIVLCDRFTDASRAYQGCGRGLGIDLINKLHLDFGITTEPDCTILLDGPVSLSSSRLRIRGVAEDRIEQESALFFEKVRAGYLEIAEQAPARFLTVSAAQEPHIIAQHIREHINKAFL